MKKTLTGIFLTISLLAGCATPPEGTKLSDVSVAESKDSSVLQSTSDILYPEVKKIAFQTQAISTSPNGFVYPQCTYTADLESFKFLGRKLPFNVTSGRDAKNWRSQLPSLPQSLVAKAYSIGVYAGGDKGHVIWVGNIANGFAQVTDSNAPLGSGPKTRSVPVSQLANLYGLRLIGYIHLKNDAPKSYGYRILQNKATYGKSSYGRNVLGATGSLNGSKLTVSPFKADWASLYPVFFKNASNVFLKVGSPESYGVTHAQTSISSFSFGTTLSVDLATKDWPEKQKKYFIRAEGKDGWAYAGEIIVERFEK